MKRNSLISNILLVGIVFTISGCASNIGKETGNDLIIFPPPPDTTRIQFLTSISSSEDITGKQSSFSQFILGNEDNKQILKPYGITVRKGKIYICDTMLGGLEVIDLDLNTFEYFIPSGKGKLKKPINCFCDSDGKIYVTDSERGQVIIYDKELNYVGSIGSPETLKPTDVFVSNNLIWVTDLLNHNVKAYSKDRHEMVLVFPDSTADTLSNLLSPTNLFVANNKVYVSDIGNFKIKVFSLDGIFLSSIGTYGDGVGQFVRPKGIAVDNNNLLYVADAAFENVQIFNSNGKILMHFGGPYNKKGDMWLPAKIALDDTNLDYFRKYVNESFNLKHLIFVTNQYGPDKINIYGFVEQKKF